MKTKYIFLTSFVLSFSVMTFAFLVYYQLNLVDLKKYPVDNNQKNVPILKAELADSKTLLLALDEGDNQYFTLIKFNAIQSKVSVAIVPQSLDLEIIGRTLGDSFEYAGIMQCVADLKLELGVPIDYYISLDCNSLSTMTSSLISGTFKGEIPSSLTEYFYDGIVDIQTLISLITLDPTRLNNEEGYIFLEKLILSSIEMNLQNILDYIIDDIQTMSSQVFTNLNVQSFNRLKRIMTLLCQNPVIFQSNIITVENKLEVCDVLFHQ